MLEFIIAASVLTLISLLFFAPTLFKTNQLSAENYDEKNTQIARERLDELKQGLASGEMSQADFELAKQELETTLAIDLSVAQYNEKSTENSARPVAILLILLMPVVSVLLYMNLGQPDALEPQEQEQAQVQAQHSGNDAPKMSMQDALAKLASRLEQKPDDPQGWFMMARTYMVMERYDEAIKAYEKTIELVGDDADLLVRYADALAMNNQGVLAGKPLQVLEKALVLNPQHEQGLWLVGVAAIEAKEFKRALRYFLQLQPMLASNKNALSELHGMIARTEQNLTEAEIKQVVATLPAAVLVEPAQQAQSAPSGVKAEIQVLVTLDVALKNKVSPQDVVFIYAKAMSGPPMPLAAVRKTVADLPVTITLNDAMAMMPAMKLSGFDKVKVGAKISKAGVAGPSAGDLYGEIGDIEVNAVEQVSVSINKIR